MGWVCSKHGRDEKQYKVLVRKTEVKRPLGRFRHRWDDNIKMYLNEVGCGLDSFGSAWSNGEIL